MRTMMMTLTLLAAGGLAAPALADEIDCLTTSYVGKQVVSTSEVSRSLEDLGYRVHRIEAEDGYYEVQAVNDSGYPIKAVFDQDTGEMLWARLRGLEVEEPLGW